MTEKKPEASTLKQLAKQYKVDKRTLIDWLKPFKERVGERTGRIYTPKQVGIIFECLGEP
jgi:hypothetical protein